MLFILLSILACTLLYGYINKRHSYWSDRGVKQKGQKFLLRDTFSILFRTESTWESMQKIYRSFPNDRYVGFYQFLMPAFLIKDPELNKQIGVKDFDHFTDHRSMVPEGADQLWSNNLFSLTGNRWRHMRTTLSPSFTSSKMKMVFNIISDSANEFASHFLKMGESIKTVELKDACTRFTNDVIASVVFGVKCNSLKEPENEFYLMGRKATSVFSGFWNAMKFIGFMVAPSLCKMLGLSFFDKAMRKFFVDLVKENIRMREEGKIVRQDMLHLLLEARKGSARDEVNSHDLVDTGFATAQESNIHRAAQKSVKEEITDVDITAQALIFFFAGFETVSTSMCFLGHELAINPDVQRKLQAEIDDVLENHGEKLAYDVLVKMKYMDMVVSEGLRKWSPTIGTDRVCVKPYTIEPTRPGESPVHFQVGHVIWMSSIGLHWDPQYFPNPEVFDPERFSDENKINIKPYTYIPFGVGPRNCIGSRFALLEIKTVFFHLLSKFDLVVVEETQIPLKLSKSTFTMDSERGFWVGLKVRSLIK